MDRTDDELTELLSARLNSTANEFLPDTDESLAVVRRAGLRRRRARVAVGATAAALVIAVGGVAITMSGNGLRSEVIAAGQASQAPAEAPAVQAPVKSDATLVMYRLPNLPPGAPNLRAVLYTAARTYYSEDLPDGSTPDQLRFGPTGAWEYGYGDVWAIVDQVDLAAPEAAIPMIVDQRVAMPPGHPGTFYDSNPGGHAGYLMYLISTGVGSPGQVKTLAMLLDTLPGVGLSNVDDTGVIQAGDSTLTYSPGTGLPIRWEREGVPSATMEFVAIRGVDASTVVDPIAAQNPNPIALPTTTLPGDQLTAEQSDRPAAGTVTTATSVVGP
ncbi:MAG TPA: hypothetical protein VL068_05210 [Microthrixaceae bacterium]|nr:hypothetical protein [Microthrixaceae bacterium]